MTRLETAAVIAHRLALLTGVDQARALECAANAVQGADEGVSLEESLWHAIEHRGRTGVQGPAWYERLRDLQRDLGTTAGVIDWLASKCTEGLHV